MGLGAAGGYAAGRRSTDEGGSAHYDIEGAHQPGIVTAQQDHLHFAAFDITTNSREELVGLLREWTQAAALLMAGQELGRGAAGGPYEAPPDDTGETLGLPPASLTLTFGFGQTLFTAQGSDRFGLESRWPTRLSPLPHFSGDVLEEQFTGGDLCIQACADDPQVATHAIRNLSRMAYGRAAVKWTQLGFGRTSSTTRAQVTPRNMMGFKDGTNNLRSEDVALLDEHVWAQADDGAEWMAGGTYLVARKIRILTHLWDRTSLGEQERAVGRTKSSGAPLSGGDEFTSIDFDLRGRGSEPLVPRDSHVALTHPSHSGVHMLRRGYNFVNGADELGQLQAGLFFIAFVRDPESQFVRMQHALSRGDAMTIDFLRTTGSALFAVPPGVTDARASEGGGFVGESLFS